MKFHQELYHAGRKRHSMANSLHFTVPTYTEDDAFPTPESDGFWVPLFSPFLKESDGIEIHCWNDEDEIIQELRSMDNSLLHVEKGQDLTVFKISNTDEASDYLLNHFLSIKGRFKWFSVFLSRNDETLFHAEHWGTAFFVPKIQKQCVEEISKIMPAGTSLNYY